MTLLKSMTCVRSLILLVLLVTPTLAHAQDQRLRVSFGGATTAGALEGQPAVTASIGYRFATRLSFEVELTAVDDSAGRFPEGSYSGGALAPAGVIRFGSMTGGRRQDVITEVPILWTSPSRPLTGPSLDPGALRTKHDGSTTLTTMGMRYELPTQVSRFAPYVCGGLGIARTEDSFTALVSSVPSARPGPGAAIPSNAGFDRSTSHTGLAATAGVGASVRVFRQLYVDLDMRYVRLDRDRTLGRFGGGVSYRF